MLTLYCENLKEQIHAMIKEEEERGNSERLYFAGSLYALIAKIERDGYRVSEHEIDMETYAEDFDDCALLSDNRPLNVRRMLSDIDKLIIRRRDDLWFYIVHVTHYTDGLHDVYRAILC